MAPSVPDPDLQALVDRLEQTATELRSGELAPERAAALVDECAQLASAAGSELDRRMRSGETGAALPPGQLALGS